MGLDLMGILHLNPLDTVTKLAICDDANAIYFGICYLYNDP